MSLKPLTALCCLECLCEDVGFEMQSISCNARAYYVKKNLHCLCLLKLVFMYGLVLVFIEFNHCLLLWPLIIDMLFALVGFSTMTFIFCVV